MSNVKTYTKDLMRHFCLKRVLVFVASLLLVFEAVKSIMIFTSMHTCKDTRMFSVVPSDVCTDPLTTAFLCNSSEK